MNKGNKKKAQEKANDKPEIIIDDDMMDGDAPPLSEGDENIDIDQSMLDDFSENGEGHDNGDDNQEIPTVSEKKTAGADGLDIEKLQSDLSDLQDKYLRCVAELDNTRKRLEKEKQDVQKYAVAPLAREIFNVADNLDRAIAAMPSDISENEAAKNFIIGLEMTQKILQDSFQKAHIEKTAELGMMFDYNLHQVVSERPGASPEDAGKIVEILQQGYKLHDRLLRSAMVVVSAKS